MTTDIEASIKAATGDPLIDDSYLLEIGTEEIPAGLMSGLLSGLEHKARELLEASRLSYADLHVWGTPRRLAVLVDGVAPVQPDETVEVRGPSEKAAYGEGGVEGGALTPAGEGFARSQGVTRGDLFVADTPAGRYIFARRKKVGLPATEVLASVSAGLIQSVEAERPMRWGSGDFRFIRPIRWIVALYGTEVLDLAIAGVRAGRATRGHRFLTPGETPTIFRASAYLEVMERAGVVVDPSERRRIVAEGAAREAARHGGWPVLDDGILEEITHLVEYPTVLAGSFSREFLDLPAPVLVTTMRQHQRYIPVAEAQDGSLLPVFIVVRNGGEEGLGLVRAGNEKVLHARLADARFFFEEDRKTSLADRVPRLDGILFLENFGTLKDKTERLVGLAADIWAELGLPSVDAPRLGRAARLAKADLTTQMVQEMTELQGVMGGEYARLSGEDPEVAQAIAEHYLPRGAGDKLPSTAFGRVVSVADKLDTITGCLAAGIEPTGSHDPHGLRRQAAGITATLVEAGYLLSLADLGPKAAEPFRVYGAAAAGAVHAGAASNAAPGWDSRRLAAAVLTFLLPRVRALLAERRITYDVADAVSAGWGREGDVTRTAARALALQTFKLSGPFRDLVASYIRLTGLSGKTTAGDTRPQPNLFSEDAESELYQACLATEGRVETILDKAGERARSLAVAGRGADALEVLVEGYEATLAELSNLRPVVDHFFDKVLVMTDDEATRDNRLALIRAVTALMGSAGDLSRLVVEGD